MLIWVISTIAMEFTIGAIVGIPLAEMLRIYDVFTGNLWALVIALVGFIPIIPARLRKSIII